MHCLEPKVTLLSLGYFDEPNYLIVELKSRYRSVVSPTDCHSKDLVFVFTTRTKDFLLFLVCFRGIDGLSCPPTAFGFHKHLRHVSLILRLSALSYTSFSEYCSRLEIILALRAAAIRCQSLRGKTGIQLYLGRSEIVDPGLRVQSKNCELAREV